MTRIKRVAGAFGPRDKQRREMKLSPFCIQQEKAFLRAARYKAKLDYQAERFFRKDFEMVVSAGKYHLFIRPLEGRTWRITIRDVARYYQNNYRGRIPIRPLDARVDGIMSLCFYWFKLVNGGWLERRAA